MDRKREDQGMSIGSFFPGFRVHKTNSVSQHFRYIDGNAFCVFIASCLNPSAYADERTFLAI